MKKAVKKSKKMTIDDLAIMTQNNFERMDKRFEKIDTRLTNLEEGQKKINRDILDIGDKFVPRSEFDNLVIRFNRLDEKVRTKLKS